MALREVRKRTILITGATDGIGLMLARAYAGRGHSVLATGRRTLSDDAAFFGLPNIVYIRADQKQPETAARAIDGAMTRLGWDGLDLAILNASSGWVGDPSQETAQLIEGQVVVNVATPVAIAQMLSKRLVAAQGQLVLIGSTAAAGNARFATYAATKAALDGFARSLHEEWRDKAHVQIIHPGAVRTNMHAKAGANPGWRRIFFMSLRGAVRCIQHSIRNRDRRRTLSSSYSWLCLFDRPREGEL